MTRWLPLFAPILLVAALLIGWLAPGAPEEPPSVTRGLGGGEALTLRPGEGAAAAVRVLRTLRSDPAPPAPPPEPAPPPPPPPPPPPDVAVVFRSALRAIERDPFTGSLSALMSDPAAPGPQTRSIRVGDRFDGWRIQDITETAVTLTRGRERRVVQLYG